MNLDRLQKYLSPATYSLPLGWMSYLYLSPCAWHTKRGARRDSLHEAQRRATTDDATAGGDSCLRSCSVAVAAAGGENFGPGAGARLRRV